MVYHQSRVIFQSPNAVVHVLLPQLKRAGGADGQGSNPEGLQANLHRSSANHFPTQAPGCCPARPNESTVRPVCKQIIPAELAPEQAPIVTELRSSTVR
eukprot:4786378-Karenia_brevis.AAC.1